MPFKYNSGQHHPDCIVIKGTPKMSPRTCEHCLMFTYCTHVKMALEPIETIILNAIRCRKQYKHEVSG